MGKFIKGAKQEEADNFSVTDAPFSLSIAQLLGAAEPANNEKNTPKHYSQPLNDQHPDEKVAPKEREPGEQGALPEIKAPRFACKQIALQKERVGRGGKTVTIVSPSPAATGTELEALAKVLRKALGCGSHVEGNKIVLQGDISDRVREWSLKNGVRAIGHGAKK